MALPLCQSEYVKSAYNDYNLTMEVKYAREVLKLFLMKNNLSMTKLADMLSKNGKKIYQQSLSAKLINGTLRYNEMVDICAILGYEIEFKKK